MPVLLLIEDNELNRDMLSRRLQSRGYQVIMAVDGLEGLSMAQARHPDLILMDMSLPLMDGWEVTSRLKADPETRSIPVLALTAHAINGDRERAIQAGCDEYDTKPVEFSRLVQKIQHLLQSGTRHSNKVHDATSLRLRDPF
jgi:CheY-like chemotaxis protein